MIEQDLRDLTHAIKGLIVALGKKAPKEKGRRGRPCKKGKWSWYRKQKFAKRMKAKWEQMPAEHRAARIKKMKAGRGL